jgi:hypothetical protein
MASRICNELDRSKTGELTEGFREKGFLPEGIYKSSGFTWLE